MAHSLSQVVADEFHKALKETEDPFHSRFTWNCYADIFGYKRRTYRETLDLQPRNCFNEIIPRIVTVRRNLRRLGPTRLDPSRLR